RRDPARRAPRPGLARRSAGRGLDDVRQRAGTDRLHDRAPHAAPTVGLPPGAGPGAREPRAQPPRRTPPPPARTPPPPDHPRAPRRPPRASALRNLLSLERERPPV